MSKLEIRLLGGFEVSHGEEPLTRFESQKVRALLAYLVMQRDGLHSRDRLAGLLWPERDDDTARRNLRQAVYNLRTALPHRDTVTPAVVTTHQSVRFNPQTDYWLDVEAFEESVRRGMSAHGGIDPYHLSGASDLYRGDFLAGFFVKDSPEFEHWLLYEQERLREMAIQSLRRLVDHYLTSRVYYLGIRYARRLLEIDPLFEEGHRNLMRLYALSGRRSQALEQYETCRQLLHAELGVEPLEETITLYQAILDEDWPTKTLSGEEKVAELPRPPLVGRKEASVRLQRSWKAARAGRGWLTLIEGEAGIGKTRLVEEAIQRMAAPDEPIVLRGRCHQLAAPVAYQPIAEALRRAVAERTEAVQQALRSLPPHALAGIARIVPEIHALQPGLLESAISSAEEGRQPLIDAIEAFMVALARWPASGEGSRPLVLFLDDLHWADRPTLDLLDHLARWVNSHAAWVVAAYQPNKLNPDHPLLRLRERLSRNRGVDRVALDRLSPSAIQQVASAVVGEGKARQLAEFLDRESAGLPLTLAELLNHLAEEGFLVPQEAGRWALVGHLPVLSMPTPENLRDLVLWRVSQLPTSARRLLTLAAVIGPQFDAELLQAIEGEHMAVVEAGVDIWLERDLVGRVNGRGLEGRLVSDPTDRDGATRWGTFEFTHEEIRLAVYFDVSPIRRRVMHNQIAHALEARYGDNTEWICEALAYHYHAAQVWEPAFRYSEQAGDKARLALAHATALHYYDQALEVLDQLEQAASSEVERREWMEERFRILALRADIYGHRGARDRQETDLQRMKDIAERLDNPERLSLVIDRQATSSD